MQRTEVNTMTKGELGNTLVETNQLVKQIRVTTGQYQHSPWQPVQIKVGERLIVNTCITSAYLYKEQHSKHSSSEYIPTPAH